jgi:hypothetical protein
MCLFSSAQDGKGDQQGDRAADAQHHRQEAGMGDEAERHRGEQQRDPEDHEQHELAEARVGIEMGAVFGVARFGHWFPHGKSLRVL